MPVDENIRYIMSFIGGGFAVAVGNWVHSNRAAQKQEELAHLRDQLKFLYGPVSYFTRKNEQLFALSMKIHGAYGAEFIDKKWGTDPVTQERVKEQAAVTVDLSNAYIEQVVENNKKVIAILEANWHLVDSEDISDFSQFQLDCTRLATEVHGKMRRKTPDAIYQALGEISFMWPELITLVADKVEAKRSCIDDLLRPWRKSCYEKWRTCGRTFNRFRSRPPLVKPDETRD